MKRENKINVSHVDLKGAINNRGQMHCVCVPLYGKRHSQNLSQGELLLFFMVTHQEVCGPASVDTNMKARNIILFIIYLHIQ